MRKLRVVLIVGLSAFLLFLTTSGRFLIVNQLQRADAIVVLAGETDRRPSRGLELLSQGYASRMVLDVPAAGRVYGSTMLQLAQNYVHSLPNGQSVIICPIVGLSTKTEAQDAAGCLQKLGAHSILLVTSDYHTRRALSIFRHELPTHPVYVAAAYDPQQFGGAWWKQRQWSKLNFDEWIRLVWWQAVDRWR
jgi:uncharacterized SAM-binding protein YcdF (DUF218 family)